MSFLSFPNATITELGNYTTEYFALPSSYVAYVCILVWTFLFLLGILVLALVLYVLTASWQLTFWMLTLGVRPVSISTRFLTGRCAILTTSLFLVLLPVLFLTAVITQMILLALVCVIAIAALVRSRPLVALCVLLAIPLVLTNFAVLRDLAVKVV
jgi:hypothetical protein